MLSEIFFNKNPTGVRVFKEQIFYKRRTVVFVVARSDAPPVLRLWIGVNNLWPTFLVPS